MDLEPAFYRLSYTSQVFTPGKKYPYSELFWFTFFPHFPAFGLNTERYGVSFRIQSECKKMLEKCGPE